MNFLEHISEIDNIINKKIDDDRKKSLFDVEAGSIDVGTGFSTMQVNVNRVGKTTQIHTIRDGHIGYSTVSETPFGFMINEY